MTRKQIKKKAKSVARVLATYREQLNARHNNEPLKPPPMFLLNWAIGQMDRIAQIKVAKVSK